MSRQAYSRIENPFPGPSSLCSAVGRLISQPQLRGVRLKFCIIALEALAWLRPTLQHFNADCACMDDALTDSDASTTSWAPIYKYSIKKRLYQLPFRSVVLPEGVPYSIARLPLRRKPQGAGSTGSKFPPPCPNLEKITFDMPITSCSDEGLDKAGILAPNLRTVRLNLNHGESITGGHGPSTLGLRCFEADADH